MNVYLAFLIDSRMQVGFACNAHPYCNWLPIVFYMDS